MRDNYRSDIYEAMEGNAYNPGVNFCLALLNITPKQFSFVQEVIQQPACRGGVSAEGSSAHEVLLSCLSPAYGSEGGAAKNVLRRNKVFKILDPIRNQAVSGNNDLAEAEPV
jgi:hypothetical protein